MNKPNLYTTKNRDYASLLLSMYQTMEEYYIENGEYYFVFHNPIKCKKVVKDLEHNRIIIDAKSLFRAIRKINRLTNQK